MKKRMMYILLMLVVFITSSITVFAAEYEGNEYKEGREEGTRYHTVCGTLPYHNMYPRGVGHALYPGGSVYFYSGCCWQCENCYLVLVTQGDYYFGQMETIRKWGSVAWNERLTTNCNYVVVSNWGYCPNNWMSGYRFNVY